MTRQKKEIIRKIKQAERFIAADTELGYGFTSANAYQEIDQYINALYEELATLSHYGSAMEMFFDMRG